MPLDRSAERLIFIQRQVRSRLVVIGGIRGQNPPQMLCTEDDNVIEAVAPQRSNQSFRIWGSAMATAAMLVGHGFPLPELVREDRAVCAVIIAHQVGRCCLPRKGLDNLLR
jgi:hypothetical protein